MPKAGLRARGRTGKTGLESFGSKVAAMPQGVVVGTTPRGQGFGGAPSGFPASGGALPGRSSGVHVGAAGHASRHPRPYDAAMSYPDRLLTEGEHVVTQFRPHWRLLVIPLVWVLGAVVAIVLAWLWIAPDNGTVDAITTIVVVAALVPLAVAPVVRWWFTHYVLTNERLITRSGMIARSGIEIPLDNITNVVFNQNVLERVLRSGDLLIESAGRDGQSRFSDIPDPEGFQSLLYKTREEQQQGAAAKAAASPRDAAERLERLANLHRDGVISDAEYEERRKALLDEI